jgi:two-component system cell cycle sensor histidine kinase/response regulator CckA
VPNTLKILILEDSPSDAKLIERELKDAKLSFTSKRVDDREDFIKDLLSSPPDLILSDYSMPLFDGMTALRLVKQHRPEIPFIVVTGAINEETAVACIKSGAEDYVIKSHLGRLGPAVQSAIQKKQAMQEKLKAEEALLESEKRYRRLFESAQEGILLLDAETGTLSDANPFSLNLIGAAKKDVLGMNLLDAGFVADPLQYQQIQNQLRIVEGANFEGLTLTSKDGRTIDIEMICNRYLMDNKSVVQCNVRDVTQRKRAEEEKDKMQTQLFQSQKMEAIGAVAGGVAHDFNNLMTAIQISTDLAMMRIDDSHDLYREFKEIRNSALRASGLIRQLLLFSRKHPMEFRTLDLNPIVDNLLRMLHRLIGEDIQLQSDLGSELQPVRADASNMEQVIMNLVLNARDAMPAGGTLVIKTQNVQIAPQDSMRLSNIKPGPYVCLSVSDTGIGMNSDTMEHLFEPFFTTKAPGKGTGLGLSVVYGIVKQHEGAIHVQSVPMKGTTFSVYLPVSQDRDAADGEVRSSPLEFIGNGQKILLVEDEDKVRESAAKAMTKCGYEVTLAGDAATAMEILQKENGRFDLVFTDVVLSGRTGLDLADEVLKSYPAMKILLCSGYTDQKSQWPIIRERGFRFLQKPYDLTSLLRAIQEALK